MGKLGRGALWVLFPPAGAVASYRAGRREDTDRIVAAIRNGNGPAEESAPKSKKWAYVASAALFGGYWLFRFAARGGFFGVAAAIIFVTLLVCGAIVVAVRHAEERR